MGDACEDMRNENESDPPSLHRFSVSTPRGTGQDDVAELLRQVAAALEAAGAVDVTDITFHVDASDEGPWPSMTVYYEIDDAAIEDLADAGTDDTDRDADAHTGLHVDLVSEEHSEVADAENPYVDDVLPVAAAAFVTRPAAPPTRLPYVVDDADDASALGRLKRLLRPRPHSF
ncbi:MAG: hypothetical protein JWL83_2520 [Actinomycetia bacterium]|nr:hypothetical protein [Actinomycetes bacterium]